MTQDSEKSLLARFPKNRPELPTAYKEIYVEHYRRNRAGASAATSAAQRLEAWMHRKVAEDLPHLRPGYRTLEIGSGNLNHLQYEPSSDTYDVVEPFLELEADAPNRRRVSSIYRDIGEIVNTQYDRIISIAAFEHMDDLPSVVAACGTLLSQTGQARIAIPSEGTLLWGLGWRFTTGIEFRLRHGLSYGVLMRHEHLNTASEIDGVLRVFFKSVRRQVFGIIPALSLYQFFECDSPRLDRCSSYLTRDRTI
jgi:hypothetical protein